MRTLSFIYESVIHSLFGPERFSPGGTVQQVFFMVRTPLKSRTQTKEITLWYLWRRIKDTLRHLELLGRDSCGMSGLLLTNGGATEIDTSSTLLNFSLSVAMLPWWIRPAVKRLATPIF